MAEVLSVRDQCGMLTGMRVFLVAVRVLIYLPLIAALRWGGEASERDVRRHLQPRLDLPLPASYSYSEVVGVLRHKPFRTILYHRLRLNGWAPRAASVILRVVYKGEPAMYIACPDVGPGLMVCTDLPRSSRHRSSAPIVRSRSR